MFGQTNVFRFFFHDNKNILNANIIQYKKTIQLEKFFEKICLRVKCVYLFRIQKNKRERYLNIYFQKFITCNRFPQNYCSSSHKIQTISKDKKKSFEILWKKTNEMKNKFPKHSLFKEINYAFLEPKMRHPISSSQNLDNALFLNGNFFFLHLSR